MHAAVRPYATAGVALVGASVIAVTPIAPPLTDGRVHNPLTQLTAMVANPFQAYVQVFQEASLNLQAILSTAAASPTPILTQILSNQFATLQFLLASLPTTAGGLFTAPTTTALANDPGALQALLAAIQTALGQVFTALTTTVPPLLQAAFGDLTSANVEGAINNVLLAGLAALFPLAGLLGPITAVIAQPLQNLATAIGSLGPIGEILANPLQNVVNVLNIPTNDPLETELIFAGLIGPLIEGPAAVGTAIQGVINAIGAGNPLAVLGAVIDAPAVLLGGVLNGGLGPDVGPLVGAALGIPLSAFFGGLLTQATLTVSPTGVLVLQLPGVIPALQGLQDAIASVLSPPPQIPAAMAAPLQLVKAAAPNTPSTLPNLTANTMTLPTKQTPKISLADPTGGTGANRLAAPGLSAGNKVAGGNGTQAGDGFAKIAAGLTGGSGHIPKHAK